VAGVVSGSRRRSRIVAFQALFESDVSGKDLWATVERHLSESRLSQEGQAFARRLVEGVEAHRAEIDAVIAERAPAFPLEEMAPVDHNVLRLAIFELLFDNRAAPLRVAINEAVEIAKGYGSESSARFVNGVLGAVALAASGESEQ
jgi:N utilization substance protein B